MGQILSFLEESTYGRSYKSYRYCIDSVEVPTVAYDDKKEIKVNRNRGETDKGIKSSKSLGDLAREFSHNTKPLFQYFLDGSRRTYKVDDIAYGNRLYPVIAGQIGVGCCKRPNRDTFEPSVLEMYRVISIPECANSGSNNELFFNNLAQKLNNLPLLKEHGLPFQKILPYSDKIELGEKYEHKGIAKIQDEMVDLEKIVVEKLVRERQLNSDSYLLKDGSLEYQKLKEGDPREWSAIKSNYQCVVGVSKAFNPEALGKEISRHIAELDLYHRTPAFMYETGRIADVKFSVWYLRIRDIKRTVSPYDGVVKVEKVLVSEQEEENGLDSDEVDRISANIINERNPVCYGQDSRWAKHLYPVYLTESYIKSKYISDGYFENLF